MDKFFLIQQLKAIENAKRENRLKVANLVIENVELFPYLIEITFETNIKISIKAAWVLEFVCAEKPYWLLPHLNYFTSNVSKVKFDSAIRPISKICGFLAKTYASKYDSIVKKQITKSHIERLTEAGFDWLIGKQKVAVKVYAMEMLYLFGENEDWIREELQLIIKKNIVKESAAYKARGKKILSWINKK